MMRRSRRYASAQNKQSTPNVLRQSQRLHFLRQGSILALSAPNVEAHFVGVYVAVAVLSWLLNR